MALLGFRRSHRPVWAQSISEASLAIARPCERVPLAEVVQEMNANLKQEYEAAQRFLGGGEVRTRGASAAKQSYIRVCDGGCIR